MYLHHFCHYVTVLYCVIIRHHVSLFVIIRVTTCVIVNVTDAQGALEMTWLQIKPEELMEPKVTMVTKEHC